ncbi:CLUMA_CG011602, isoform A [Clunio marinus]|uniref:CLUMA_CG011602, isoform A n=1 Tax=Clunio marinus TaxID=568069 RepID=A0A1J1IDE8_9DIPT|nr:CLUMA_CG011602, isoform A [Clunio marinus]
MEAQENVLTSELIYFKHFEVIGQMNFKLKVIEMLDNNHMQSNLRKLFVIKFHSITSFVVIYAYISLTKTVA